MNWKIWMSIVLMGSLVASVAVARPPYRLQAITQFHLVADKNNDSD